MAGQDNKGGGASKYGRNKIKCSKYRARKDRSNDPNASKRPRGIGNLSLRVDRPPRPFVNDDAYADPERCVELFIPFKYREHLTVEMFETGARMPEDKGRRMKQVAQEQLHKLRPWARERVQVTPTYEKPVVRAEAA